MQHCRLNNCTKTARHKASSEDNKDKLNCTKLWRETHLTSTSHAADSRRLQRRCPDLRHNLEDVHQVVKYYLVGQVVKFLKTILYSFKEFFFRNVLCKLADLSCLGNYIRISNKQNVDNIYTQNTMILYPTRICLKLTLFKCIRKCPGAQWNKVFVYC